jgi:hypothetical protein
VDRVLIQKVVDEARSEEANLVIWDGHLRVKMQDGRVTVYVEFDHIYKLVVERERSRRSGARTGFGAASS